MQAVCAAFPVPGSSFFWLLFPSAPSWSVSSNLPQARLFPVNGFPLQSKGKIFSKSHYDGIIVTSLLSNEPCMCTVEEAPNNQMGKLTHSLDISQSYPSHLSACSMGHKQGGHRMAGMEAIYGFRSIDCLYPSLTWLTLLLST